MQHKRKYRLTFEKKILFNLECNEGTYKDAKSFYDEQR